MSDRDNLARLLEQHPAYSTANDQQDWFKAREAANAVIAAGWVPEWEYTDLVKRTGALDLEHAHLRTERDALAATVERVTALCAKWTAVGPEYVALPDATAQLRDALAPSDPATDTGGEG